MRWLWLVTVALTLTPPSPAAPAEALVPYQLSATKHVVVRVKVNGQGPYNFIMDTGAPPVLMLEKVGRAVKLKTDDNGWARLDRFELEGGLVVPNVRTRVSDLPQAVGMNALGLAGVEIHGVIGYEVLARYKITYDFTAERLKFVPLDYRPKKIAAIGKGDSQGSLDAAGPFMNLMAGLIGITPDFTVRPRGTIGVFTEVENKKVVITGVVKDSPADKAGLKPGDAIQSVALQKSTGGFRSPEDIDTPRDLPRVLSRVVPGKKLKLTVGRGDASKTVTLTLSEGL